VKKMLWAPDLSAANRAKRSRGKRAIDHRSLFVLNPACPRVADIRRLGGSRKTPNPTSS
jgi:hypothetical protein